MSSYWTQPVNDREPGARMTWVDMNRITNNLNYLGEQLTLHQLYHGRYVGKTSWTWNDYVTRQTWSEVLAVLQDVTRSLGMTGAEEATYATTYQNINIVETFTWNAYKRLDMILSMGEYGKYVDAEVYPNDDYYLGGVQDAWSSPYRRIRHYVDTEVYCNDVANVGGVE